MRKTITFEEMVEWVNERNRTGFCDPLIREGWNQLLESMLMKTDAYNGFGYYTANDLPYGQKPGIIRAPDPINNQYPDETRRFYYLKSQLRRRKP